MEPPYLDHIGIAVRELDAAVSTYGDALGLTACGREHLADRGIEVAIFQAGSSRIELIAAAAPDSEISKYLQKRGEGLHHICLQVTDLDATLGRLKASGVRLIDQVPRTGAEGKRTAFVHPHACHGVLIELAEKTPPKENHHGR